MTDTDEVTSLLRRYAADGSDDAFLALMQRYMDLVYGAALRRLNGDAGLAQDVVQRVFLELAREARRLKSGAGLGGWLYRRAVHMAADVHKSECRRTARERAAALTEPCLPPVPDERADDFLLEDAIGRLPAPYREAVVLRFLENRPLRSVGDALGISEDAAQKRISRALDKLRRLMGRRSTLAGTGSLTFLLSRNSASAAPAGALREAFALCQQTAAVGLKQNCAAILLQAIAMKPAAIVIAVIAVAGVAIPFLTPQAEPEVPANRPAAGTGAPEIARPEAAPATAAPGAARAGGIALLPGLTEAEREIAMKSTRVQAEKVTQQRFEEKMERLRKKLDLTDAQAEAIAAHHRAQRDRMIAYMVGAAVGEADPQCYFLENYRTDVPAALRELLSEEQQTKLADHEATRRANFLEATTNGELSALALKLELNEDAKDALFAHLNAINSVDRFADAGGIKDLEGIAAQADRDIERRREVFAKVLTADQMKSWEGEALAWRAQLLKTFGHREASAVVGAPGVSGRAG